jgi:hypothetical protein
MAPLGSERRLPRVMPFNDPEGQLAAERMLPELRESDYEPLSVRNVGYNCFAWAAREYEVWVEPPGTAPWASWPADLPTWDTLTNRMHYYERRGCRSPPRPADTGDFKPTAPGRWTDPLAARALSDLSPTASGESGSEQLWSRANDAWRSWCGRYARRSARRGQERRAVPRRARPRG